MTDTISKPKILIVDDDHFLLNMYSVKFKNSGYEPVVASGAEEAYAKLKAGENPEVIIFDIVMPGISGIEFLEKIKKEKLSGNSAVIALTNQDLSSDIEKAKSLGVDGYIVKASTIPSEVVEEVGKILKKKAR